MSSKKKTSSSSSSSSSIFSIKCGCKDSKSVSVSADATKPSAGAVSRPDTSSADTLSSSWDAAADDRYSLFSSSAGGGGGSADDAAASASRSFSGLLRQLGEMEQSLVAWGGAPAKEEVPATETTSEAERLGESVAVVKESEDPLGDFRNSMAQMIVEKEIFGGEGLKELLGRFLSLNHPRHHPVIVRAFAEIWEELFRDYYFSRNAPVLFHHSRR
ncbi:hypothetical protein QJS04_geneDACA013188 [Acorus gramineus]|uniref:Transcription repressor n=1 Tax=Acorus gramineus TaxID=55184 RepID=A0AAV9B9U5_ACOGR|nr:hypothetical protein QJS04_geneDACA013188 [Acorus gramineus]